MNRLIKIIKKIIFALSFMFTFNLIFQPLNVNIPINIYSVALYCTLGIPSFFYLIILKLII